MFGVLVALSEADEGGGRTKLEEGGNEPEGDSEKPSAAETAAACSKTSLRLDYHKRRSQRYQRTTSMTKQ